MPRTLSTTEQLKQLIAQLQQEKQQHLDAIAEIDQVFAGLMSGSAPARRLGRPPKQATAAAPAKQGGRKRRGRRQYETTGPETLLGFIRAAGAKGARTRDVVAHWKSEGRSGDGFATLNMLINSKKIRKEKMKNERGSRYFLM